VRRALAAEARKLWTVRTTWILTLLGLGLVGLATSGYVFGDPIDAPVGSAVRTATAVDQLGANAVFVLVVGLVIGTTEYRHATIGRSLQLTPHRVRLLTAKLLAAAGYALAFAVAAIAVVALLLVLRSVTDGAPWPGVDSAVATSLWRNALAVVLLSLLGAAVGSLVRSQVIAITLALVWMFLVENLAAAVAFDVARWLPLQALNALFLAGQDQGGPGTVTPLPPWLGVTVVLAYVTVATASAAVLLTRRDV
jgi:ABC-2 type transport system permease protein